MRSQRMLLSPSNAASIAFFSLLSFRSATGNTVSDVEGNNYGTKKPMGSCPFIGKCPYNYPSRQTKAQDVGANFDQTSSGIPNIPLKHVALALRLTSQLNQRLQQGTRSTSRSSQRLCQPNSETGNHYIGTRFRGGENQVLLESYDEQEGHDQHQQEDFDCEPLTSFHVKSPFEIKGAEEVEQEAWGPDIEAYFRHILDALDINENEVSIELALTLIYLDRACSVETQRSNGLQRLPFCTPQTVHRLSLVALLTALRSMRHDFNLEYYHQKLESVLDGISLAELQYMIDWMEGALGDSGYFVSEEQFWQWTQTWSSSFQNFPAADKHN